jgi:hypothetical protein
MDNSLGRHVTFVFSSRVVHVSAFDNGVVYGPLDSTLNVRLLSVLRTIEATE